MVCPFKRNKVIEIVYDYNRTIEDRKSIKEITKIEFGACEGCGCPFFNLGYDTCSFKGVIQE